MKFSIIFIFSLLTLKAFTAEVKVPTTINTVEFYPNSGKISRNGTVNLSKGEHTLVFENLSVGIKNQDIRFYADEGIELKFIDFETVPEKHYLYKRSKKSLDSIMRIIKVIKNIDGGYKKELEVLNANKAISTKNAFVEPDDIELISVYSRKKYIQVNSSIDSLNEILSELEISRKAKYEEWQNINRLLSSYQIIKAYVRVSKTATFNIGLEYTVNNMGWEPYYQIKVDEANKIAQIDLNTRVYQNTLENFNNVEAYFLSREPQFSGEITQLNPWYIFEVQNLKKTNRYNEEIVRFEEPKLSNDELGKSTFNAYENSSIEDAGMQFSYKLEKKLDMKYSIKNDKIQFKVKSFQVPISLIYKAQPRLNNQVNLVGYLTEFGTLGLIPGNAKLYVNNVALANTYFNTNISEDTLMLNFGYDPRISLTYTKDKVLNSKQFIGTNKTSSFAYKTEIKNNTTTEIDVEIENQVPVSTDTRIEISVGSTKGGDYNTETGIINRTLKMKPGEKESYVLDFTVKYPKNMIIGGL